MLQALFGSKKRSFPAISDVRTKQEEDFLKACQPHLEALENIRQKKLQSYSWRKRVAMGGATAFVPPLAYLDFWLLFLQRSSGDDSIGGITALFLGALYWWLTQPRREYARAYKDKILPQLAELFGGFLYWDDGAIPVYKMQSSKILPRHDKYEAQDYFVGQYKGVNVEFSEVDFKQKRRSKNRTYYVSVFKGLAVLLDMNSRRFFGHTLLDRDRSMMVEWFKEKSGGLKRANLVDPEFEKIFDVYTNDQVEARYLIDPVMIENLKSLQDEYDGENITAAFYESKLLVLIKSDHNYFEPAKLEVPATDPRSILRMKREIGQILSLIDRLSLYDPDRVTNAAV